MQGKVIEITWKTLKSSTEGLTRKQIAEDKKAIIRWLESYRKALELDNFSQALFAKRILFQSFGVAVSTRIDGKPFTVNI